MITNDQRVWLEHLRDNDTITIVPYDPRSPKIFESVKEKILKVLGTNTQVHHRGATSYKISGQDEIDIYIPISTDNFDLTIKLLTKIFGKPKSVYPQLRGRFSILEMRKRVDIMVTNKNSDWLDKERFDQYLRKHPEAIEEYRVVKERCAGLSTRNYYTKKTEFINSILTKTDLD